MKTIMNNRYKRTNLQRSVSACRVMMLVWVFLLMPALCFAAAPNTPTLVSPADGATGTMLMPMLKASDFSDPGGGSHANSHWQVSRDSAFTDLAADSRDTYQAGIQANVPPEKLRTNTTYYWRVRYKNSAGEWSAWSSSRSFTTSAVCGPVCWGDTKITAVFSDYGSSNGIWSNDGNSWSRLSDWIPYLLTGYGSTGIGAAFDKYDAGNGIWRYESSSWNKLTDWQPQVMLSYGSSKLAGKFSKYGSSNGIWKHEGSSWNKITDWVPDNMSSLGSSDLAGGFSDYDSGNGIYKYDGNTWARITDWAPERMLSWGSRLAAVFTNYGVGGNGVWIYEGTSWRRASDWTPAKLLSWKNDTQLAGIFNNYGSAGNGVWNYDGTSWDRITDWVPVDMTKLGTEDLIAVFKDYGSSGNGVWKYSSQSWQRITDWVPETISYSGDYITAVFSNYGSSGNGVWKYRSGAWTKLTDWRPTCTIAPNLGAAAPFGGFGGNAGMTNEGTLTVINNGDIGTTGVSTTVTGFHDSTGDGYTETPLNKGDVKGRIYTDAPPPVIFEAGGPYGGTATTKKIADDAAADAQKAYDYLKGLPGGPKAGAGELGGLTLTPGTYTSDTSFNITNGDLTLNGTADDVWVFQVASTLTVGAPGFPRNVILTGGAQAKNVFWQVSSAARIEDKCNMVGTIIAYSGVTISTSGQAEKTTLDGRAQGLAASVTLVNTVINVPSH